MKKLIPLLMVVMAATWWLSCSSEPTSPPPPPPPSEVRVVADTNVTAPTLSSADEEVWSGVTSYNVPVKMSNNPKRTPSYDASIPSEVTVQAIKKNGTLYLRLQWADPTFDVFPDHFEVDSIGGGLLPVVHYGHHPCEPTCEDQVFVMFDGMPNDGWDVWNWQAFSTACCNLGKGYSYTNSVLTPDAAGTASDTFLIENVPFGTQPTYAHKDTSNFTGYILYLEDAVHHDTILYQRIDTTYVDTGMIIDTLDFHFWQTSGWEIGQKVPGWLVDSSFASLSDAERGSRWDIHTVSTYDSSAIQYRVVMARALNTGYSDDLDMSSLDSVEVKIGFYDNQREFLTGSSNRGFSDKFRIILPQSTE